MILITKTVLEEETSLDTFHQKFELISQIINFAPETGVSEAMFHA